MSHRIAVVASLPYSRWGATPRFVCGGNFALLWRINANGPASTPDGVLRFVLRIVMNRTNNSKDIRAYPCVFQNKHLGRLVENPRTGESI